MSAERKARAGTIIGQPRLDTCWQTPPELLGPVRDYFGGPIPCDAATAADNPTKALVFFTDTYMSGGDGLSTEWPKQVWVNPPYGRVLREWFAKMEREAARGVEIVSLLPCARWEQAYFQSALSRANALCFIRKRVAFIRPSTGDRVGGNPYANMFIGWNADPLRWQAAFGGVGRCFSVAPMGVA